MKTHRSLKKLCAVLLCAVALCGILPMDVRADDVSKEVIVEEDMFIVNELLENLMDDDEKTDDGTWNGTGERNMTGQYIWTVVILIFGAYGYYKKYKKKREQKKQQKQIRENNQ